MHFQSHFNTAVKIIQSYDGAIPFASYLKQYFTQHKKHGSKDRKHITHLCYCYYRLGHALKELSVDERLKVALFLCNDHPNDLKDLFDEEFLKRWNEALEERIQFIRTKFSFNLKNIFPFTNALSEEINAEAFCIGHLIQPDLFIRIRPGFKNKVTQKLNTNNISFHPISEKCLSLFNTTKINELLELNKEAVIQDYSSQRISEFFEVIKSNIRQQASKMTLWDCCAASGGKAILAKDVLVNIHLTVSDVRPSIIHNLNKRFREAGISNYTSFVADLTANASQAKNYDIVICDVPCSGSGTWSRTPEQLYFFKEEKINYYSDLQKKIVNQVCKHVKKNGYLLYITCSVFKQENEDVARYIQQQCKFKLMKQEYLKGYDKKADTMFAALFTLI